MSKQLQAHYVTHQLSQLTAKIESLVTTLTTKRSLVATCVDGMRNLRQENQELRKYIDEIKLTCNRYANDIMYEAIDRIDREKNLVIQGLPDSNNIYEDCAFMNFILAVLQYPPKFKSIHKMERNQETSERPIKVVFYSADDAKYVLRNKEFLYRKAATPKLIIRNDWTPLQQQEIAILNAKLEKRIKNGESNLTIRYIDGRPKIAPHVIDLFDNLDNIIPGNMRGSFSRLNTENVNTQNIQMGGGHYDTNNSVPHF